MDREIAVAGVKPDGLSQFTHSLKAEESIALYSPAALLAEQSGEDVGDGVEVGGDIKAPPLQIVTGIYDDGEIFGGNDLAEAVHKLGAAGASGEHDNHAAFVLPA